MEDEEIIELYFSRDEAAIAETRKKYGRLAEYVASRILPSPEDAEEAVSDALLAAWDTIPPKRPQPLGAYIAALCRSRAIDLARASSREKRGGGEREAALEELSEIASGGGEEPDRLALREALNSFLAGLNPREREIFLLRYWWQSSAAEIAREMGMTEGAVKMGLSRTRKKLREHLEKEGFTP